MTYADLLVLEFLGILTEEQIGLEGNGREGFIYDVWRPQQQANLPGKYCWSTKICP